MYVCVCTWTSCWCMHADIYSLHANMHTCKQTYACSNTKKLANHTHTHTPVIIQRWHMCTHTYDTRNSCKDTHAHTSMTLRQSKHANHIRTPVMIQPRPACTHIHMPCIHANKQTNQQIVTVSQAHTSQQPHTHTPSMIPRRLIPRMPRSQIHKAAQNRRRSLTV